MASASPVIQINGDNPSTIHIGDAYADLNPGIHLFLNGSPVDAIQVDTSATVTDTIDYVVSDAKGLTATSTRTVIIERAQAPSIVPDNASTSAPTTSAQ